MLSSQDTNPRSVIQDNPRLLSALIQNYATLQAARRQNQLNLNSNTYILHAQICYTRLVERSTVSWAIKTAIS